MNPLTNMRNVTKLSQRELEGRGKSSWHDEYKDSAWIFVGGLPYDLTEGDILAVFSQYGEIVNVNLIRDKATGKSKGFTFICYENQKSTILAVDNFNGMKILGRSIRVDHVKDYKPPKDSDKYDDITRMLHAQGCAPEVMATSRLNVTHDDDMVVKRRREEDEDDDRDDGLGSHSVLKGFKNTDSRIKVEPTDITADDGQSSLKHKDKHKVTSTRPSHHSGERAKDKEEETRPHRERSKKKHRSKKSKRTHSKSKKDKKRKKHKKRSSSSDSSDSSSSSDSESESSSSESDDSRKRRRHKKKSSR